MATTYTRRIYSESDRTKQAKQALDDHSAKRPDPYESDWLAQLDEAVQRILDREPFQYDLNTDPLYRQYHDNYVNQGRMAMQDTLGQAAALTGGYGNSFGQLAAQQAYNTQLQSLNGMIPQLYQLALDTYDRQGKALYDQYGILSDREGMDYSRYRDALGDWGDERGYLTGRYDTERGFDYSEYRDLVGDDQWQAQFDEDIRRFDFENKLGEFAPVHLPSGGSSGGSSYKGRAKKEEKDEEEEKPSTTVANNTVANNTAASTSPSRKVKTDRTSPRLRTKETY